MALRLGPLALPGFENKPPLASAKEDYPVYWQGENLVEGYGSGVGESANDTFARQGYLIRLPRVVRVFVAGGTNTIDAYYQAYGAHAASTFAADRIAVSWGESLGGTTRSRYIRCAIPAFGDSIAADDLIGGECLIFVFSTRPLNYGTSYPPVSINALFQEDYDEFVAKRLKFARVKVVFYQNFPSDANNVFANLSSDQIQGNGVYSTLAPLTSLGWTYTQADLTTNLAYSTFDDQVSTFFGL